MVIDTKCNCKHKIVTSSGGTSTPSYYENGRQANTAPLSVRDYETPAIKYIVRRRHDIMAAAASVALLRDLYRPGELLRAAYQVRPQIKLAPQKSVSGYDE